VERIRDWGTTLALHPASQKNPAGAVELGFTVPDVLAQFADSEGGHCRASVAAARFRAKRVMERVTWTRRGLVQASKPVIRVGFWVNLDGSARSSCATSIGYRVLFSSNAFSKP
jgi:hypothetical protein